MYGQVEFINYNLTINKSDIIMSTLDLGIAAYDESEFKKAFDILMPLAKMGNPQAQKIIAHMYGLGQGVEMNNTEAIKWYRLPAELGDPVAQNNLASILLDDDHEEAMHWYHKAAEQNFPFAQEVLGDIYSGDMNLPSDSEKKFRNDFLALKWYHKAAGHGFLIACHRLGEMYAKGQGVEKDEKQALKWYLKAATDNHQDSLEVLAQAYLEGLLGLPKDPQQAEYWLKKANSNKIKNE